MSSYVFDASIVQKNSWEMYYDFTGTSINIYNVIMYEQNLCMYMYVCITCIYVWVYKEYDLLQSILASYYMSCFLWKFFFFFFAFHKLVIFVPMDVHIFLIIFVFKLPLTNSGEVL